MSIIVTTPKSALANSYASVATAIAYLRTSRLTTTKFDEASAKLPSAEGFLAAGLASAGVSSVPVDGGTGTLATGDWIKFAGHATEYELTSDFSGSGSLELAPALTDGVADNEAVERLTANPRERSLIWATSLFDSSMDWNGFVRTTEQRLRMPRSGMIDLDGENYDFDTYPEILVNATIEQALALLTKNRTATPALLGLGASDFKVGPLSVKVDESMTLDLIPEYVISMLEPLGSLKPSATGGDGMVVIPLSRT